jgi:purine catabolism regulator
MLPSLESVLASSSVRLGSPEVLTGAARLHAEVRWVHVSEVSDVRGLLRGGELILSTGLAMNGTAAEAVAYLEDLVEAGACGLIVELSDRFREVPEPVLAAAGRHDFPIIALHKRARFVAITEEAHMAIVAEQYMHVQYTQRVHETFTTLSLEGATAQTIVEMTASMCEATVVLEDLARRVVAYAEHGTAASHVLADWQQRSRLAPLSDHTVVTGPEDWTAAPVGMSGQHWGRLVVPRSPISHDKLTMLLERASQALELGRMIERDRLTLSHQAQGGFLGDLADNRIVTESDALARAEALGLVRGRSYIPVVVHISRMVSSDPFAVQRNGRYLVERVSEATRNANLSAIIGSLNSHEVGLLLSCASGQQERELELLARAIQQQTMRYAELESARIGVGNAADSIRRAASTMGIAQHVAEVASAMGGERLPFYRSTDVRLRGLLALLHNDARVQAFVESELSLLLAHEASTSSGLVDLLRQYIEAGGNKTELARLSHRSRPSLYAKLADIERILKVDLDNATSRMSLGVALMVHDHVAVTRPDGDVRRVHGGVSP